MAETQTVAEMSTLIAADSLKPPRRVRRPNAQTGRLPKVKVCGYALNSDDLEAWSKERDLFQDVNALNQRYRAIQTIMCSLPESFCWGIVRSNTEDTYLRCIVVGSNETKEDLIRAYTPARAKRVAKVLGKKDEPPKWYYYQENFD
ncbi:hypothetical protein GALMADRAFT_229595 [Galerina marginata CBS 339.88]|uniref:Uncharacterized protein n=1 Tax=Galerina marginata (strain CBS 339.88) TaxID=685588 RepID=A0A067SL56_GALM3|nr:hypothetical protein GALMADRAFT_229595 [Galerina marginata CBS 339.88]